MESNHNNLKEKLAKAQETLELLRSELDKTDQGTIAISNELELSKSEIIKNQEKIELILQNLKDPVFVISEDFDILFVNNNANELFGSNLIGNKCFKIFNDNDECCELCPIDFLLGQEHCVNRMERSIMIPSLKKTKIFDIIVSKIKDYEGKRVIIEVLRDITKQKKAEQKYKSLFETSQDAIMTLEPPEWAFTSGNPATLKMFKVKDENDFCSRSPWQYSPKMQPDGQLSKIKAKDMIDKAMKDGSNYFEWMHKRLHGENFPATVLLSRMKIGERVFLQATVRDITEKKKTEQKLKSSEEKYRNLFFHAPSAIFLIHQSGKILRANEKAKILFKYEEEELLNSQIFDLFAVESLEKVKKHYNSDIYDLKAPNKREFLAKTKIGKLIYVEVISTILRITDDLIIQSFILDITERKNYEENRKIFLDQLMESIEFKSKFMANMSHELRTPLNAILGFSQLLIEDSYNSLNSDQKDFLKDINSAGKHLLNLINGILDLAKIEAGKFELNLQEFKIYDLIAEVNAIIKPLYVNKGIEYNVEGLDNNDLITADAMRLKQIFYNLLSNGIKFTDNGSIVLRIINRSDYWEFQVIDTGIGIGKENYEVVFREFGRIENDRTQNIQGAGLGLALTKRLVNIHGGEIWFKSELGKGTTFFFTLPKIQISD